VLGNPYRCEKVTHLGNALSIQNSIEYYSLIKKSSICNASRGWASSGETDAQGMCTYIISTRLLKGGYFGLRVGKEETTGELSRRGVMVNTVEESASIRNWPHQDIIEWERDIECEQQQ
jgi:hypothetical protein